MTKKQLTIYFLIIVSVLLTACDRKKPSAPIFQVEVNSETMIEVGDSDAIKIELETSEILHDSADDEKFVYQIKATVSPSDGPVRLTKLAGSTLNEVGESIETTISSIGDVSTSLEVMCVEAGDAEIIIEVNAPAGDLFDENSTKVKCVISGSSGGEDTTDDVNENIPETVDLVVDVFDFSCRPTFDEYNQLSDRTPGFQGLFSFDHPQADLLLGGQMPVIVVDPDGRPGSIDLVIQPDSSSGGPIGHFSFYDPQLSPGTYTWEIPGITLPSGAEVHVESGGTGEFEITEQSISGCKL